MRTVSCEKCGKEYGEAYQTLIVEPCPYCCWNWQSRTYENGADDDRA